jgi:hypothetical protein
LDWEVHDGRDSDEWMFAGVVSQEDLLLMEHFKNIFPCVHAKNITKQ